jgi:AsmA-like C-terminal region
MRLARIATLLGLLTVILLAGSAALILFNQSRIVVYVLASVRNRTGVDIIPRASSVHLGTHLIVILDEPQVIADGREIVKLKALRAIVSYHSIFTATGLPLFRLTATNPEITLPMDSSDVSAVPVPRPGPETVGALNDVLRSLARIAWSVEATDATVHYSDGTPLADHVEITAHRTRREPNRWRIGFDASMLAAPVAGAHVSGKLSFGTSDASPPGEFAGGQIWTRDVPLNGIEVEGLALEGSMQASLKFLLHTDGSLTGGTDAGAQNLWLKGERLAAPIELGGYTLHAGLNMTDGRYALTQIVLRHVNTPLLSGDTVLLAPNGDNPELGIHLGPFHFDAAAVKQKLLSVRHLRADVVEMIKRIKPGKVTVGGATMSAALAEISIAPLATIRKNLVVSGTIQDAGFAVPPEAKLPPVEDLSVQLRYEKGQLTISQGTAKFGNSAVHDLAASANLSRGIDGADYRTSVNVEADLAELHPAIAKVFDLFQVRERDRLLRLGGRVDVTANAAGKLSAKNPAPPADYQVLADAVGAVLTIKGSPGPLEVRRGNVAITPTSIKFNHLMLAATGGDATLDGALDLAGPHIAVHDLTLDFHDFPSQVWVSLLVDPGDFWVSGPIGGRVVVNSDPRDPTRITPEGKLTLAKGDVQFNFLRAPLLVQGATLTMHRKSIVFSMPGSKLEDQAINFKLTVPDYTNPSIRIDAAVQRLDLEVMRFIRMPWSPATPPIHFSIPASGHIEARAGNLGEFQMTDLKTDFTRSPDTSWHVYNMSATAYRGKMKLELVGRAPDNWIEMKGSATDMDPAPLFMLGGKNQQSPLLGHLFVGADLWANTDTNFFETLAGDMSVTVRDGTLNKFTLLSRLLGLIDIKNWLSAKIPDPRVNGVPFKSILADFKGRDGLFYTDNFVLQGPVMDITATGSLQFGAGSLDMQVGMYPFDTVDWVLNKIPLIGERIGSGTGKLIAAYFQVRGPVSDPSITPKPITSVAEFVKKTLGIPINIIRPHTIK